MSVLAAAMPLPHPLPWLCPSGLPMLCFDDSLSYFFMRALHSTWVSRKCSLQPSLLRMRSLYAFSWPTATSNGIVSTSKSCLSEATTYKYLLATESNNFLTRVASFMAALSSLNLFANSLIILVNLSIDSISLILRVSNSLFKVCALAFFTRSMPTYQVFILSHATFTVFFLVICKSTSSGMDWKMHAFTVLSFFESTTIPAAGLMAPRLSRLLCSLPTWSPKWNNLWTLVSGNAVVLHHPLLLDE